MFPEDVAEGLGRMFSFIGFHQPTSAMHSLHAPHWSQQGWAGSESEISSCHTLRVAEGIELAHRLTNLEVGSRKAKALGVPGDPIKKMKGRRDMLRKAWVQLTSEWDAEKEDGWSHIPIMSPGSDDHKGLHVPAGAGRIDGRERQCPEQKDPCLEGKMPK